MESNQNVSRYVKEKSMFVTLSSCCKYCNLHPFSRFKINNIDMQLTVEDFRLSISLSTLLDFPRVADRLDRLFLWDLRSNAVFT